MVTDKQLLTTKNTQQFNGEQFLLIFVQPL